jgi:hypothetical protein
MKVLEVSIKHLDDEKKIAWAPDKIENCKDAISGLKETKRILAEVKKMGGIEHVKQRLSVK